MSIAREQPRARTTAPWVPIVVIALLLLAGLGAWAYFQTRPASATATRRNIIAAAVLPGTVVAPPLERADLEAPYEAPVAKVYATLGQKVDRGDTLVELSLPNAQAVFEQARAAVRSAETAYANTEREYSRRIAAAKRAADEARAAERSAVQPPAVTVTPAAPGSIAITPPPGATADPSAASQARTDAEQELIQLQSERDAALEPLRQQLDSAREYFRQAQSGRKMALVRASISGTVLALNARPGEVPDRDDKTPLVTIVDLDALEVHASMDADTAGHVKPQMDATITAAEAPNEQFEGKVKQITTGDRKLLKGQQYVAILSLVNKGGLVKPAMKATAAIELGEVENVVAVPSDAVDRDGSGRPTVKVLRNGRWEPTIVESGLSDAEYTEIRSGVKEGDTVQVTPSLRD